MFVEVWISIQKIYNKKNVNGQNVNSSFLRLQSNLYITTTQGTNRKWPLWTGGLYIEVPKYSIETLTYFTIKFHYLYNCCNSLISFVNSNTFRKRKTSKTNNKVQWKLAKPDPDYPGFLSISAILFGPEFTCIYPVL